MAEGMYDDMKNQARAAGGAAAVRHVLAINNYVRFPVPEVTNSGCASPTIATTRC